MVSDFMHVMTEVLIDGEKVQSTQQRVTAHEALAAVAEAVEGPGEFQFAVLLNAGPEQ